MTEKRELRVRALQLSVELSKINPPPLPLREGTTLWDVIQMQSEAIEEYILSVH